MVAKDHRGTAALDLLGHQAHDTGAVGTTVDEVPQVDPVTVVQVVKQGLQSLSLPVYITNNGEWSRTEGANVHAP